jgi:hypothetical protein
MPDENDFLELLCVHLPALRRAADEGGWRPRLDAEVTRLRLGRPASEVCERLGLALDPDQPRGALPPGLAELGLQPVPVRGDYACPHGICPRRSQPDPAGHAPTCVDGTPMRLRPTG